MRVFLKFAIVGAAVIMAETPAHARVQPQMFCWSSDVEFPVACEEEEDEDEGNKLTLLGTRLARHGLIPDTVPSLIEDQR